MLAGQWWLVFMFLPELNRFVAVWPKLKPRLVSEAHMLNRRPTPQLCQFYSDPEIRVQIRAQQRSESNLSWRERLFVFLLSRVAPSSFLFYSPQMIYPHSLSVLSISQEWFQLTGTQWVSVSTVFNTIRSSLNTVDRSSLTMTLSNRWPYWFSITSEVLTISWKSSSCRRWERRMSKGERESRRQQAKRRYNIPLQQPNLTENLRFLKHPQNRQRMKRNLEVQRRNTLKNSNSAFSCNHEIHLMWFLNLYLPYYNLEILIKSSFT